LFITTFQPLELAFFNSIQKFLTILYFEWLSTSFYLLFFPYMLYNSKWSENFQACSQLALKNGSKEDPPFGTLFHINVSLWSATARFFVGPQRRFLSLQMLISCNLHCGDFEIFSTCSQSSVLQDPTIICVQKCFFFKIWYLYSKW